MMVNNLKDISDNSFSELSQVSKGVCEWLQSLGVTYKNTRFDKYSKNIENIQSHALEGNLEKLDLQSDIYLGTMYELSDLSYAQLVFVGEEPCGLVDLLEKLVKGVTFTTNEIDNKSKARDFSFEVATGARLAASGFNISFQESGDVYSNYPFPSVYIQCKRPKSIKALERRAKRASDQLKVDLDNEKNETAFGLIAIDATRIINPNLKTFVAPTRELSDDWHMQMLSNFCTQIVTPLAMNGTLSRHEGIIGVMVRFSAQWGIQDSATIHYQHDFNTINFPGLNQEKQNYANRFNIAMQKKAPKFINILETQHTNCLK